MEPSVTTTNHQPPVIMARREVASSAPLQLPDLLAAVDAVVGAAETLQPLVPLLRDRVERNRLRSERHHRQGQHAGHDGNGRNADIRLVLTARGIEPVCRRCGLRVAS